MQQALLILAALAGIHAATIHRKQTKYNTGSKLVQGAINVHLVPHSQCVNICPPPAPCRLL